jgi:hypothetical protein
VPWLPLLGPDPSEVLGDWPAAIREMERARLPTPPLPFRKLHQQQHIHSSSLRGLGVEVVRSGERVTVTACTCHSGLNLCFCSSPQVVQACASVPSQATCCDCHPSLPCCSASARGLSDVHPWPPPSSPACTHLLLLPFHQRSAAARGWADPSPPSVPAAPAAAEGLSHWWSM